MATRPSPRRELRDWLVVGGTLVLLALAAEAGGVTVCPTAGLTGTPCPGCGLTRAIVAALGGHMWEALGWHPLVVVIPPALIFYATTCVAAASCPNWKGRQCLDRSTTVLSVVLLVLLIGVWLVRLGGGLGGRVPVNAWFW